MFQSQNIFFLEYFWKPFSINFKSTSVYYTYIVEVAGEDALLQRTHEHLKELEIERVQAHLLHVDVPRWHRLVSSLQPFVAVAAIRPGVVRLHDSHQVVTEGVRDDLEPEDIRARLRNRVALIQLQRVIRMYVLLRPIVSVGEQSVEVGTCHRTVEVIGVDQMSEIALIGYVHEDALSRSKEFSI